MKPEPAIERDARLIRQRHRQQRCAAAAQHRERQVHQIKQPHRLLERHLTGPFDENQGGQRVMELDMGDEEDLLVEVLARMRREPTHRRQHWIPGIAFVGPDRMVGGAEVVDRRGNEYQADDQEHTWNDDAHHAERVRQRCVPRLSWGLAKFRLAPRPAPFLLGL